MYGHFKESGPTSGHSQTKYCVEYVDQNLEWLTRVDETWSATCTMSCTLRTANITVWPESWIQARVLTSLLPGYILKHDTPFEVVAHAGPLYRKMFADSKIAKSMYVLRQNSCHCELHVRYWYTTAHSSDSDVVPPEYLLVLSQLQC